MTGNYGGFWRRAAAFFVDTIILHTIFVFFFLIGLIALHVSSPFAAFSFSSGRLMRLGIGYLATYQLAVLLVSIGYFTYFHALVGQTPGKMIFGLKVLQINGDELSPGIAFLRWVGYLVSGLFFHLGFLWIAFHEKKRGWHDLIAGTVVIRIAEHAADHTPTLPTHADA